ncbi:MAG: PAS domain-containing protein [Candidatus Nanopelagicales bacterium]
MLDARTRPTGVERSFAPDEIIVTKTDLQGRITYANEVFLRVSALAEDEAVGRPHNLIRHPDMPRGVFRLLWDRLQSRQELFAYVLNMATDGSHYWVFAHVTPSVGSTGATIGYHSNRRLPSRTAVSAIQPLYREMLAAEASAGSANEAAARGYQVLVDTLAERGQTYDEFVWTLTTGAGR